MGADVEESSRGIFLGLKETIQTSVDCQQLVSENI
jgi:hypothetical protein